MRQTSLLLILLLTGCQGLPAPDRLDTAPQSPVMAVWERYQQCLVTDEPGRLLRLVEHIERIMLTGPEPPDWMKFWSPHVRRQPLRTAVDPRALGAACTLRAARLMAEQDRLAEARDLYQRVLSRYPRQAWAYYHEQAREALASLPDEAPAVLALRNRSAP